MESDFKTRMMRIFTFSLLAIVVIGGLVMIYPSYRRGQELRRQDAELQSRIDAKKREIDKLIENQRRFQTDPDFIEKIARQNRRVFPGELVFVFEED